MTTASLRNEGFERKRQLAAVGLLCALAFSQFGFFTLLQAGFFWTGYFSNTVLWTAAFMLWAALLAPLRISRGLLNTLLFFLVLGAEIGAWILAQGFSDSAYCSRLPHLREPPCFIDPATQDAGIFFGLFFVPVTLAALVVSIRITLREPTARLSAVPSGAASPAPAKDSRSGRAPTLLITAGLFVLGFIILLVVAFLNMRPPT